ncbi:MAG TPA: ABC transporter substrate-binding protein [Negativicutes bacterium]|nr:ABC transporter substrate-binding protein [Negativicutes bacterium]
MKMSRCKLALLIVIVLIFVGGCAQTSPPTIAPTNGYQVTDCKGNVLTLPRKPQRIVSLNIATDEILLELVAASRIAALTYLAEEPGISNVVEAARQVPTKIRANAEIIIALQPDLVLTPDWQPAELAQGLRDAGLTVYVFQGAKSIADVRQTIRDIAQVVGEPEQGDKIIVRMNEALQAVNEKVKNIPEAERPIVARVSTMGGSGGAGTSFDDICRHAGVRNAGVLAGINATATLTQEQLLQIDPDLFLLPTWDVSAKTDMKRLREEIEQDPSLQTVKAVKNHQMIQIPDRYLFCTSQYIAKGVQQLAAAAYPQRFKLD